MDPQKDIIALAKSLKGYMQRESSTWSLGRMIKEVPVICEALLEREERMHCKKCGAEKYLCPTMDCCPHPIDWFCYKGSSCITCRLCGGTVMNPHYVVGEVSWGDQIQILEGQLTIAIEGLEKAKDKLGHDFSAGHELKTQNLIDMYLSRVRSSQSHPLRDSAAEEEYCTRYRRSPPSE